eukprot:9148486-Lingulodinium_polyedra.AAC.1
MVPPARAASQVPTASRLRRPSSSGRSRTGRPTLATCLARSRRPPWSAGPQRPHGSATANPRTCAPSRRRLTRR